MEQAGDGVGTDRDAEVGERHSNLGRRSTGPLHAGDGIVSCVVFEKEFNQSDDVGGFFRPARGLRRSGARPGDTFRSSSCWLPRPTVCAQAISRADRHSQKPISAMTTASRIASYNASPAYRGGDRVDINIKASLNSSTCRREAFHDCLRARAI